MYTLQQSQNFLHEKSKVKVTEFLHVVTCIPGETGSERLHIRQENHALPVLPAIEDHAIKTSVIADQDLEKVQMVLETSKIYTIQNMHIFKKILNIKTSKGAERSKFFLFKM